MTLADLTQRTGEWLRGAGPMQEVVISSRVRLARNLAGMPFLSRCSPQQTAELEKRLRDEILAAGPAKTMFYVDVAAAREIDRRLLVERHLISRQHARSPHPRGVAISDNETVAIMINEEDHLRMQVIRSGLQLSQAVEEINRIDDLLEDRLDFAFHSRYGYLTACPTNVGTGIRVSVMLHLPALKLTGEIEKVFQAARDMRVAVRGLYGEGTDAAGDFYQVSNQTTLGKSEEQIVEEFRDQVIPQIIKYELTVRQALLKNQRPVVEDKVFRAAGLLRSARLISSEETLYLLSMLRAGVNLGLIEQPDLKIINELFLLTQPAHLQKILSREMDRQARDEARAHYVRSRLGTSWPN